MDPHGQFVLRKRKQAPRPLIPPPPSLPFLSSMIILLRVLAVSEGRPERAASEK